jgi:catechol 2,3-dioxygenase-like lactoylglutathione lyase family enzyme
MSVSGPLSHIDISVGYPERSIRFYDALLTSIGYRRWRIDAPEWSGDRPQRATWSIRCADGSIFGIEVRPARETSRDRRYDRYEPGPHHLAFHAGSEAAVDQAHHAVVAAGGAVLDPPTEYGGHPAYGAQYYAVFFSDPDGVKLEVCYVRSTNP